MLYRKIMERIETLFRNQPEKALLIIGARQVGKSYTVDRFAEEHFKQYIKLDFIAHPEYIQMMEGVKSAEEILMRISAVFGNKMIPGETLIFFDEVQQCPELVTQVKYLVQEGSYRYILSGSLLGTVIKSILSMPVGYINVLHMYPMDFEEFALANGVSSRVVDALREAFLERKPVDSFLHGRILSLFELYLIVGGMPAVVSAYLEAKNLARAAEEQKAILELYKQDISKYDQDDKLTLNEIFDLIPSELNAKNKRFILKNLNEHAKYAKYDNSFLWLKNAGVALPVPCAEEPKVPLLLSKSTNLFKLFLNDVGLLAAQYGTGIQLQILRHETEINFGAIYENAAAQELTAHGFTLYYYNSKKLGEVDFMIETEGKVLPIEIKSGKDYYRHKAISNLTDHPE